MLQPSTNPAPPILPNTLSLREMTELLVKHYGFHDGLYDLALEFQIAVGAVGPQPELIVPGAMIGISRIGITKTINLGPHTVDAALINPAKKPRVKAKA